MIRHRKPPSQTWRTCLDNHAKDLVSIDFFTVPTATFRILYVLLVLKHERREVVHLNVTEHPTAQWAAQQMVEAFPFDTAPRYLLRDRDANYGERFRRRLRNLGIEEVLIAPHSPWQSPYVKRLIGSIRGECLDHVIVINERHLKRLLSSYFSYYHRARRRSLPFLTSAVSITSTGEPPENIDRPVPPSEAPPVAFLPCSPSSALA